jgi:hypothetical protein
METGANRVQSIVLPVRCILGFVISVNPHFCLTKMDHALVQLIHILLFKTLLVSIL